MDDASDRRCSAYARLVARQYPDRFTYLRSHQRRSCLPHLVDAVRHVCRDPETIIVTLDADDALLGPHVLDRVHEAYERGADLTVGSMLRTDKHADYPVDFEAPRANGGGNVWQHLRTFKKKLFDAIPDEALRLDGEYIDLADDWAYMLPLVDMADQPVAIDDHLYLHEPSGGRDCPEWRATREQIIGRIVEKPACDTSSLCSEVDA